MAAKFDTSNSLQEPIVKNRKLIDSLNSETADAWRYDITSSSEGRNTWGDETEKFNDRPICKGFWSPIYNDLYGGDIGAISNHLGVNQ